MYHIDMTGKKVVVTGAARGLAYKSAQYLAEAGADIAICDILDDSAAEAARKIAEDYHVQTLAGACDVSDEEQVNTFVDMVHSKWGRIDVLVNAAGISFGGPSMEIPLEKIKKVFEVNVYGTINTNRAVLKYMMPARSGKIVNFASVAGKSPDGILLYYGMSKAAVIAHTRGVARELGMYNININCVCPGIIRTPMWDKMIKEGLERAFNVGSERILLGRPQEEEDIAGMVLYLSSDFANNITAQAFNVDGGISMY